MKKMVVLLFAVFSLFSLMWVSANAEGTDVETYLDGVNIKFDVAPQIIDDHTMVPLRRVFEVFDMNVTWHGEEKTVLAADDAGNIVIIVIDSARAYVNGEMVDLPKAPVIIGDRTLVPLRFIAESLGCQVDYTDGIVNITSPYKVVNVQIEMADGDVMDFALFPDKAPKTVENFATLANGGFYDGLTFHRIVEGFVIQGGDPTGTGTGGSDAAIEGEFSSNGFEGNDISHKRGVISMARSNDVNSASSQFFICQENSPFLDGEYAGFGRIINGIEVVDSIVANYNSETPVTDSTTIKSIRVLDLNAPIAQ